LPHCNTNGPLQAGDHRTIVLQHHTRTIRSPKLESKPSLLIHCPASRRERIILLRRLCDPQICIQTSEVCFGQRSLRFSLSIARLKTRQECRVNVHEARAVLLINITRNHVALLSCILFSRNQTNDRRVFIRPLIVAVAQGGVIFPNMLNCKFELLYIRKNPEKQYRMLGKASP
jgi:hypothetical protein